MKTPIRYTLALFTACTVLPAAGLLAQSPSPAMSATPSVSMPAGTATAAQPAQEHEGGRMRAFEKLTPEEQAKLKAANQAAKEDPAVKAAAAQKDSGREGHKAYREAHEAAMIKADPSVKPIMEKMKALMREERPHKKDF